MKDYNRSIGIDSVEVTYDTWLIGFDVKQNITDYEVFLHSSKNKEDELKFIKTLNIDKLKGRSDIPKNVATLALVVETVGTDRDACVSVNTETIYEQLIQVKNI